jgi:hypothetical protein
LAGTDDDLVQVGPLLDLISDWHRFLAEPETTEIVESALLRIRELVRDRQVILASAHAVERDGVNAIPEALADELGARLGLPVDEG